MRQANRFILGWENWRVFDRLIVLEQQAGITATYHFYADPRSKTLQRWLLDPSYSIEELAQSSLLKQLSRSGHQIGLHPGFDTWHSADKIDSARDQLERAAGITISHVRQHWRRFSWCDTWNAQVGRTEAGHNFDVQRPSRLPHQQRPCLATLEPHRQHSPSAQRPTHGIDGLALL